jgi:hypothetical protein
LRGNFGSEINPWPFPHPVAANPSWRWPSFRLRSRCCSEAAIFRSMCCAQVQAIPELLAARVVFEGSAMNEVEKVVRYLELATLQRLREELVALNTAKASMPCGPSTAQAAEHSEEDKPPVRGSRIFSPLDMLRSMRTPYMGDPVKVQDRSEHVGLTGLQEVTASKSRSAKRGPRLNAGSSRKRRTRISARRQPSKATGSARSRKKPAQGK